MNYFDYQEEIRKNPNFDKEETLMLELSSIDYTDSEEGNEARTTVGCLDWTMAITESESYWQRVLKL